MYSEKSKNSTEEKNPDRENQNRQLPEHSFSRSIYKALLWGTGTILLVLLSFGTWVWTYASTPSPRQTESTVLIPKGTGVRQIKTILAGHGLIKDDIRFLILARLTNSAKQLKAGEFMVPPGLTPVETLQLLKKGEVLHHQITIPEGTTSQEIAEILTRTDWIDQDRFLALTGDRNFIRSLGINQTSLEGYLFPDTYLLTRDDTTAESLIVMMVHRFKEIWQEVAKNSNTRLKRHEVLTLASIVEKETGEESERPIIASVFLNRLKKGIRLQSDPTVIYGIKDFDGNLTRSDLKKETPYNTYVIAGLPPGPICNPGREAIKSILDPADAPYLYFVSRNDGTHQFSTNLKEHNKAVRKFQKRR